MTVELCWFSSAVRDSSVVVRLAMADSMVEVMVVVADCMVELIFAVADCNAVAMDCSALSVDVWMVFVVAANEVARFALTDVEIAFLV